MNTRLRTTPWVAACICLIMLTGATTASLFWGSRSINPHTVGHILLHISEVANGHRPDTATDMDTVVVLNRVPRTITAIVIGAALAVAGAGVQGVSRNPLGDPGLLGLSSGAAAAIVLGMGWLGLHSPWQLATASMVGSCLAAALVFTVSHLGNSSPTPMTLTLSGAAVNAGFMALTSAVVLSQQEILERFRYWNVGSVSRSEISDLITISPLLICGFALVLLGASGLNAMALGDDLAHGLGVHLGLQRTGVLLGVVILAGAATAIAGPIAFVGLLIPHVIRRLIGGDYRWILALCLILGPVLLLVADTLGRIIAPPQEIYVGISTVIVGVPVLLLLLRRSQAVAL